MVKPGPKPKTNIDTAWRSDLAYVVGLLASDGCLSSDGRHIELTSKDRDQLETFVSILGIDHIAIGTKVGGYAGSVSHRVQFGSVVFYQWLFSVGLTPRKSHTIGVLHIPDQYFADFLRGVFDGDGSIYAYWDTRWKSSYLFYLEFTSASRTFLDWLQNCGQRLYGVRGVIKKKSTRRAHILRYAKRESGILLDHMYAQDHSPRLARKSIFQSVDDTQTTIPFVS